MGTTITEDVGGAVRSGRMQTKREMVVVGARAKIIVALRGATRTRINRSKHLRRLAKHRARNARLVRRTNDVGRKVVGVTLHAHTLTKNRLGELRGVEMARERRSGMLNGIIGAQFGRRTTLGSVEATKLLGPLDRLGIVINHIEVATHLLGEWRIAALAMLEGARSGSRLHGVAELVSDNEGHCVVGPPELVHHPRPDMDGMGVRTVKATDRFGVGRTQGDRTDEVGGRAKGAILAENMTLIPVHHSRFETLGNRAKLRLSRFLGRRTLLAENIAPVPAHDRRSETGCE